jgi:predicted TPR repeat methyltransferase
MAEPTQAPPREVSLEEAIAIAILFQKNGQLAEAEEVYCKVLAVEPDHPDALHFAGILAHQQGRHDEGIELIQRSLQLAPDRADCYSNLGIIFKAEGRVDEAVAAYTRALELNPNHANAHSNLGVLLRAQDKLAEAEAAYRKAIELDPEHIDAYHNLGVLLASQRRTQEAVVCYCKVTTLSPQHSSARRLLALAHCTLGEPHKAVEIFERWLAEEPDNPIPRHMLAACSGNAVPVRASDAYVETIFDEFAASFEAKLAKLSYRAPAIVGAMLVDSGLPAAKNLDVLDAGCGTGLCGSHLSPFARRLVGVDLSSGMLAGAREKQVYDELEKAELTEYLRGHSSAFDVIVSADTLVYFGDLAPVASAASLALRSGGLLIFTVEERVGAGPTEDFSIGTHGRYSHAQAYIERVLTGAGLRPEIVRAELRMESGAPVQGLAVRATKTR